MNVQESATSIVKTLVKAGYTAYFAGGWVRDFLLQHPSDDIDIATDAPPHIIQELFPKTVPVGLAFGVVIVIVDGHQFEVASFRQDLGYSKGRRPDKIMLSNPREDALRRDFTINGLFFDPLTGEVHDFVQGTEDLKKGIIRTIGPAHERFAEDRLRMVRAVRFAARFGFEIDEETRQAIRVHAKELFPAVAMERIWQEFNKMAKAPRFADAILEMHHLGLLTTIFPSLLTIDAAQLQQHINAFDQFPADSPPILYLLELFPELPVEELLEICQYLKASNEESRLAEFASKGRQLLHLEKAMPEKIEQIDWANFYSNRFFQLCFEVLVARYPQHERAKIIETHSKRRERLLPHILRISERKPLVTASVLKDYGILPGKQMGALLKEAERLAIAHDLHSAEDVIKLLRETHLWPK